MSAYTSGRGSQIISLSGMGGAATAETFDHLPSLPQIGNELEAYFLVARQIEAALIQERSHLRKARDELRELQLKHSRIASENESKIRDYGAREERLHSQIGVHQQTEKNLRDQMAELSKQIGILQEEKKKVEFNSELLKANIDYLKERESKIKDYQLIRDELKTASEELKKYQGAWKQVVAMDRKAKQVLQEAEMARRKVEELTGALSSERRRNAGLEELIAKEKREKQVALSCLHTSEARTAQLNREIEELRSRIERSFEVQGLELKF